MKNNDDKMTAISDEYFKFFKLPYNNNVLQLKYLYYIEGITLINDLSNILKEHNINIKPIIMNLINKYTMAYMKERPKKDEDAIKWIGENLDNQNLKLYNFLSYVEETLNDEK